MELAQHIPSEGLKICAEGSLTGKLGHIDYASCPAMLDTAAEVRSEHERDVPGRIRSL